MTRTIWHKADEEPDGSRLVLGINASGTVMICGPYHTEWKAAKRMFRLTDWAYVDELTPYKIYR